MLWTKQGQFLSLITVQSVVPPLLTNTQLFFHSTQLLFYLFLTINVLVALLLNKFEQVYALSTTPKCLNNLIRSVTQIFERNNK